MTKHIIRPTCDICNVVLTQENVKLLHPHDFLVTCEEHAEYAQQFQIEIIQKKLGIIKEFPEGWAQCNICHCDLSQEEIDTIETTDISKTCEKHREVKKWFQRDIARDWFEFKKENTEAIFDTPKTNELFYNWREVKYTK